MAQNKYESDLSSDTASRGTFNKEVGSLQSTARGDAYLRENPADFNHGGDGAVMNPALIESSFVAKAVDDGVIENPSTARTSPSGPKASNVHKISDALRRTRQNVSHQIHTLSDGVKSSATQVSHDLKEKAIHVGGEIKSGVTTAHNKVKANPYPYAIGAVAVGFLLGRLFLSRRSEKVDYGELKNYQADAGRPAHTGIHI